MKKNKIASNDSINKLIYKCFGYITQEDQYKFLRKFNQYENSETQKLHLTRELILGAFIISKGQQARYDVKIDRKTPDWCIFDDNSNIKCLVELTSIHIDRNTEQNINDSLNRKKMIVFWRDGNRDNIKRLNDRILKKVQSYKRVVINNKLSYFVAIFFHSYFSLNYDEIQDLLMNNNGIFKLYPQLSGVVVFEEKNGYYLFKQFLNANAIYPFTLYKSDRIFPI